MREEASAWTRPLRDVRDRLKSFEASLDVECLSLIRKHYVDVADPDMGFSYKAPPTLEPPPGVRITDHHLFLDHYGNKKNDPEKTCDYVGVLSRARQRLGRLLPPGRGARPKDFYDHYDDAMGGMFARWPRSLLCAAPNNDFELVGRLNASRLWLEMANPANLAKLRLGAPFFAGDDDDSTRLDPDEQNIFGVGSGGYHSRQRPFLDAGPVLYDIIDVSPPEEPFSDREETPASSSSPSASFSSSSSSLSVAEKEDDLALEHRGVPANKLMLAVAECSFLDPIQATVYETTFAYSAAAAETIMSSLARQKSRVTAPATLLALRKAAKFFDDVKKGSSAVDKGSGKRAGKRRARLDANDHVRRFPGVAFLPALPAHVFDFMEGPLSPSIFRSTKPPSLLSFWTYVAPLLLLLLEETPDHVTVVLPPQFGTEAFQQQFKK